MQKQSVLSASLILSLFSLSSVQAAGFSLIEQSASGQGLSYAGAAANPEDASVMWFNPAGMTEISNNQLIVAAHIIAPSAQFNNDGSYIKNSDGSTSPLYGKEDNGAGVGVVPNFYWKGKAGDYDLGLGVNVPFGSVVDYDQNWVGRYHAVYTETKTYNLNPSIARKFGDNLSLGFGLNAQYINVVLSQKIDFGVATGAPQQLDGYADLNANALSFGYNFGAMYDFKEAGRLGFSYRSEIDHKAKGKAKFDTPAILANDPRFKDSDITSNVVLPASASLSYVVPVGDKFEVLADATWTGWSSFQELRIEFDNPAKDDAVQPQEWTDAMRYALGMTYQMNDTLKLRTGVALDQTPIKNKYLRTPRIADSNRTWLSVGVGYKISDSLNLDVGYTRIFSDNPEIEATDADTQAHVLKGDFAIAIDILSAQLVWNY